MVQENYFSTSKEEVNAPLHVEVSKVKAENEEKIKAKNVIPEENITGIEKEEDVDDDEMEQEEMFVSPDISLGTEKVEWGGPRRGGRFLEPTRFGDWERKGRATDF
ncbi:hypothetical protein CTEN210_09713 [Chaetoceros tenuissimus]|uniref:Succinate dehydrogenase assembly factor 4, mitochondrial n=1 Tax=Chaetoceros tenuissimus TaxID=426638 RepID=A0AAD3H7A4_9STRA|nr:hypothetical protein CTEN210_09713 [Chaetoceros tenuissimus]